MGCLTAENIPFKPDLGNTSGGNDMNLVFLFLISTIFSNNLDISSTILDDNYIPISNVVVLCNDRSTFTDNDGFFSIDCYDNSEIIIKHIKFNKMTILSTNVENFIILSENDIKVSPIIVYGQFNQIGNKAHSTQVITEEYLNKNTYSHIQDITPKLSNVNYAQGTSRPRYYQIRGLGELSQFSGEGAPHFYVGYTIDHIDFSGIGMLGNLFDIKQIEVFKGPQSTLFGQNSMGGQINITTLEPKNYKYITGKFSMESFNTNTFNLFFSNQISDKWNYAATISKHYSDGFIKNKQIEDGQNFYLSNTNGKDEELIKLKFNYFYNNIISKITFISSTIDNKYDVWTPDNNGFITYTDYRGKDLQQTNAISVYLKQKYNSFDLISISTYSDNKIEYSYDSDWGNNDFWSTEPYNFNNNYYGYYLPNNYIDSTSRRKINKSQEVRLIDKSLDNAEITTGIMHSITTENDNRDGWLFAGDATNINSRFTIQKTGFYSSLDYTNNQLNWKVGFRYDSNKTLNDLQWSDYYGLAGSESINVKDSNLFGATFQIDYKVNNQLNILSLISSGYKSSGINMTPNIPEDYKLYDNEYAINFEIGIKSTHANTSTNLSLFYIDRYKPQLRVFYQHDATNPNSFDYATFNSDMGYNYGVEFDIKHNINNQISINSSLGYLNTYISNFTYLDVTYGRREQAHSPEYNYSVAINYKLNNHISMDLNFNGMDDFFFDDQYDYKSKTRNLIDLSLNSKNDNFSFTIWTKNLTDEKYAVRGYTFGLNPPEYLVENFKSYGAPRTIGITIGYSI